MIYILQRIKLPRLRCLLRPSFSVIMTSITDVIFSACVLISRKSDLYHSLNYEILSHNQVDLWSLSENYKSPEKMRLARSSKWYFGCQLTTLSNYLIALTERLPYYQHRSIAGLSRCGYGHTPVLSCFGRHNMGLLVRSCPKTDCPEMRSWNFMPLSIIQVSKCSH